MSRSLVFADQQLLGLCKQRQALLEGAAKARSSRSLLFEVPADALV